MPCPAYTVGNEETQGCYDLRNRLTVCVSSEGLRMFLLSFLLGPSDSGFSPHMPLSSLYCLLSSKKSLYKHFAYQDDFAQVVIKSMFLTQEIDLILSKFDGFIKENLMSQIYKPKTTIAL